MAAVKPYPAIAGALTPIEVRKQLAGMFVQNADGTVRPGVLTPYKSLVSSRSTRQVGVDVFGMVGATENGRGAILGANDGVVLVDIDAAPSSGLSRLDLVYAKPNDSGPNHSDTSGDMVIARVSGSPASSNPQLPTLPTRAIALASVLMPSGATTTQSSGVVITQLAPYTATAGGIVPLRSQAEMAAFAAGEGQCAVRMDRDTLVTRRGGKWVATSPVTRKGTVRRAGPLQQATPYFLVLQNITVPETGVEFVTIVAHDSSAGEFTLEAGAYDLSCTVVLPAASTGHGYLDLVNRTTGTYEGRVNFYAGADRITLDVPVTLNGSTKLRWEITKTTGSNTSEVTGDFTIVRKG